LMEVDNNILLIVGDFRPAAHPSPNLLIINYYYYINLVHYYILIYNKMLN